MKQISTLMNMCWDLKFLSETIGEEQKIFCAKKTTMHTWLIMKSKVAALESETNYCCSPHDACIKGFDNCSALLLNANQNFPSMQAKILKLLKIHVFNSTLFISAEIFLIYSNYI